MLALIGFIGGILIEQGIVLAVCVMILAQITIASWVIEAVRNEQR